MTLSLMFQKVKMAYLKFFENAFEFQPLKTISRLTGLAVFGLSYGAFGMAYLTTISFFITILFMDIIWFMAGQKESTYKSAEFFEKHQITAKNMDRYNLSLMVLKIIAIPFCIHFPYLGPYFFVCILGAIIVGVMTKILKFDPNAKPMMSSTSGAPGFAYGLYVGTDGPSGMSHL